MQRYADVVLDKYGRAIAGASVLVKTIAGTNAVIYGSNGGVAIDNPIATDGLGRFAFYAADGRYKLEISIAGSLYTTVPDILLEDPADASTANIDGGTIKNVALEGVTLDGSPLTHTDLTEIETTANNAMALATTADNAADAAQLTADQAVADAAAAQQTVDNLTASLADTAGSSLVGHATGTVADALDAIHLADYSALRAYTGPRKSVYVTGYLVSAAPIGIAGSFTVDDGDTTSADNDATIIVDGSGRRWKRVCEGSVDPRWFGASKTATPAANKAAVQAAVDYAVSTGRGVHITEKYNIAGSIQLAGFVRIFGDGYQNSGLIGDGTGPVFKTGVYPAGDLAQNREITYEDLWIENNGAACIEQYTAVTFAMRGCHLLTANADALKLRYSFRAWITDNHIVTSGNYCAISALDNCNNLVIERNRLSAGSAGKAAINVGQSQGVKISGNVIESSGAIAIALALDSESGNGNCHGIEITGNYIEACDYGASLGRYYSVMGAKVEGNFIQLNAAASPQTGVELGRVYDVSVAENSIELPGPMLTFYYATNGSVRYPQRLMIERNFPGDSITAPYAYTGTWVTSFREALFGSSEMEFYPVGASSDAPSFMCGRKTICVPIDCSANSTKTVYVPTDGGRVHAARIIGYTGSGSGTTLRIGSSTSVSEVASVALAASYSGGFQEITLSGNRVRSTGLLVENSGVSTAKFTLELEVCGER